MRRTGCALRGIGAVLALVLAAVLARAAEGVEPLVTLRLEVPPKSTRGPDTAAQRAILEAFLQAHPHIRVEPVVALRMNGPRAEATRYMMLAGDSAPDVLYVYARSMAKYIDQGFLYPLDEYLGDDVRRDPLFRKLLPGISRGGHVYGVTAKADVHALLYRKDLFQAAGLDPERPPRTWEELLDCARRLTPPGRGQHGLMLPGGGGAGWRFANFVWQAGGDLVRQQDDGSWMLTLDQPRTLRMYRVRPGSESAQPPRVETYRAGAWTPLAVAGGEVQVAPADGSWSLVREEPGQLRLCLQRDGAWRLDQAPDLRYGREWTPARFEAWLRYHTDPRHASAPEQAVPWRNPFLPPGLRALAFYREMRWGRDAQGVAIQCLRVDTADEGKTVFDEGRVAMLVTSTTGDIGRLIADPGQVGLAPLPAGPELTYPDPAYPDDPSRAVRRRRQAAMLEGEFYGLNAAAARDPARRAAAWQYLRFLVGEEAQRLRTRTYVEAGQALNAAPRHLRQFGYADELRALPAEWITFYDQVAQHGQLEPYAPGYDQVAMEGMARLDEVLFDPHADPAGVIDEITREANSRFFAQVPPEVQGRRRTTANVVFFVLLGAGVLAPVAWRRRHHQRCAAAASGLAIRTTAAGRPAPSLTQRTLGQRLELLAWLFLAPAVLSILVWAYYPLVKGAWLAFIDYRIMDSTGRFVGLDNFIEAFTQPTFWRALGQTAVYTALSLGLGFLAPIVLAMLLSEIPRLRMLFRGLFYLPAVTSGLVVMSLWKMMYDHSAQGAFNAALGWLVGAPLGRAVLCVGWAGLWLLLAALLAGAAAAWWRNHERPGRVLPAVLLVLAAPVWLEAAQDLLSAAGAATQASPGVPLALVSALLQPLGLSLPVCLAAQGAARLLALVLTILAVLMLTPAGSARPPRWPKLLLTSLTGLMALAVAAGAHRALPARAEPYAFLQDPTGYWAMLWVILPGIWAGAGPACIIYLAAIQGIPDDLYEAADVDGAGPFDKAYHVTLQYLKPLILINFVGAFVGCFHAMENVLVLTGGGPSDKTMTIGMDIFFNAFTHLKFGYATAEAWVLGSLLIGFTVYQLRVLKTLRFTRAS